MAVVLCKSFDQNDNYVALLSQKYSVLVFPVIKFVEDNLPNFCSSLRDDSFAGIVLTSPRSAQIFLSCAQDQWASRPIFAVGPKTASYLQGFNSVWISSGTSDLVKVISDHLPLHTKLLYPCSDQADSTLASNLESLHFTLKMQVVYRTLADDESVSSFENYLSRERPKLVAFFSGSCVRACRRLHSSLGEKVVAVGGSAHRELAQLGVPVDGNIEAPSPDVLRNLIDHLISSK